MPKSLNQKYRNAAEELARRVASDLGNKVDSVVLYRSVARGEARQDSDIDILVVSPDPKDIRKKVSEICEELIYQHGYTLFISTTHFNREELDWHARVRNPFMRKVSEEGVILYDDGTFSRKREETTPAS